jgi:phage FluMu protein Com
MDSEFRPVRCGDCNRLNCEATAGSTVRVKCRCGSTFVKEVRAAGLPSVHGNS